MVYLVRLVSLLLFLNSLAFVASGQCYVRDYTTMRKLLRVEGDFVVEPFTFKRLYKLDGQYLLVHDSFRRLLYFENGHVLRFSDRRRIGKLDGRYLLDYRTLRRVALLDCPGQRSALAAAAYFLN